MKLSIIIPAKDEEGDIEDTLISIHNILKTNNVEHEILIINDHSVDSTLEILSSLEKTIKELKIINNSGKPGFGLAIRQGLENYSGDIVAIVMADGSDSPKDLRGQPLSFLNVGTGKDISIKELAFLISKIVGFEGKIKWDLSKPDGTPKKLLDTTRINKMGWKPKIEFKDGLNSSIKYFEKEFIN